MSDISAGKLWGLRRLADGNGRFKMLAADQRPPIKGLVAERRNQQDAPYEDVCDVKAVLVRELAEHATAVLLDPHYAYPAAIHHLPARCGLILTLEDSVFDETPGGRTSSEIDHWSVAKIKRAGGDAVKVLAWHRPDADAAVIAHQKDFVGRIGEACARYDLPFVFELLLYPLPGEEHYTRDYVEQRGKRPDLVIDSVATFADPKYGVDVFKLESPVAAGVVPDPDSAEAAGVQGYFDELGRVAGRPWVMLSAGATKEAFRRVVTYAYRAGASGYLAGRAIWWDAFQTFPDLDDMAGQLRSEGVPYMEDLNRLTDELATPWHAHPGFGDGPALGGAGPGFRTGYADFEGAT